MDFFPHSSYGMITSRRRAGVTVAIAVWTRLSLRKGLGGKSWRVCRRHWRQRDRAQCFERKAVRNRDDEKGSEEGAGDGEGKGG